MIDIIPAIDIIGGKCVRLVQGDYSAKKIYSKNPLEIARTFEDAGIKRLHLVDLDGARAGHVVNMKVLADIASGTQLVVDFGGGIKTDADIQRVFDSGAGMVTIGSIAATNPSRLDAWITRYGSAKIIVGADVKNHHIAISGWLNTTDIHLFEYLEAKKNAGVSKILCTDISRDGMLEGPAIELYKSIKQHFEDLYLIASGGVTTIADVKELWKAGIDGVVIGKAIYESNISLDELNMFL